jgi:hypothetical protein
MTPNETHEQKMIRITGELDKALRRQAEGTWRRVRTADRAEPRGHAWQFRPTPDGATRFLRVSHKAMEQADNPAMLLSQLSEARWLARLDDGPETSLVLGAGGRLEPFSQQK